MGIFRYNYRSQVLGRNVDITVVIPTDNLSFFAPGSEPRPGHPFFKKDYKPYKPGMKFQTIYLMHGGGDDDTLVYRYTNAERYATENCVMLVTPNIPNSFGADTEYGVNYSAFLTGELPVVIQSLFPSSPAREDNFIVGYAMGGNAALGNAIMHPQNYAVCVDMSGGIGYTLRTETMVKELEDRSKFGSDGIGKIYGSIFGRAESFPGSRHDLVPYIKKWQAEGVELPKFILMCGSKEFIRERVEGDVSAFRELGIDIDYIVCEGYDHDFDNWDKYFRVVFGELLPLRHEPIYSD